MFFKIIDIITEAENRYHELQALWIPFNQISTFVKVRQLKGC